MSGNNKIYMGQVVTKISCPLINCDIHVVLCGIMWINCTVSTKPS